MPLISSVSFINTDIRDLGHSLVILRTYVDYEFKDPVSKYTIDTRFRD